MQQDEIVCQELVEMITDYLEGALSTEDTVRIDAHLRKCDGCLQYLEQMRTTVGVLNRLRDDRVHPPEQERFLALFRDWKGRPDGSDTV